MTYEIKFSNKQVVILEYAQELEHAPNFSPNVLDNKDSLEQEKIISLHCTK